MSADVMDEKVKQRIENYMIEMDLPYEKKDENTWMIEFENMSHLVIHHNGPNIMFRTQVMKIPHEKQLEFFRTLLELNLDSMTHGAYALQEDNVVIVDTLEAENLDLNEFQASVYSISMAIVQDYKKVSKFLEK